MHVKIARLSEELDLDSGHAHHHAVLRLPDGSLVHAALRDADIGKIIANLPTETPPPGAPSPPAIARSEPIPNHVPRPALAARAPHVAKDDMGYPVVTPSHAPSPLEDDEEGIRQV